MNDWLTSRKRYIAVLNLESKSVMKIMIPIYKTFKWKADILNSFNSFNILKILNVLKTLKILKILNMVRTVPVYITTENGGYSAGY